jgi:hypothetical protein
VGHAEPHQRRELLNERPRRGSEQNGAPGLAGWASRKRPTLRGRVTGGHASHTRFATTQLALSIPGPSRGEIVTGPRRVLLPAARLWLMPRAAREQLMRSCVRSLADCVSEQGGALLPGCVGGSHRPVHQPVPAAPESLQSTSAPFRSKAGGMRAPSGPS